ncbi:hypothetical protein [Proteus phage 10]|nr:hypothetical protein [Proteus phage 10]
MFTEKLIIVTAPLRKVLRLIDANNSVLQDPQKLLSILSVQDVVNYYVVNKIFADGIDEKFINHPLVRSLANLVVYTKGVSNSFSTKPWTDFIANLDEDLVHYIESAKLNLYKALTGDNVPSVDAKDDITLSNTYVAMAKCAPNDYVVIDIVPRPVADVVNAKRDYELVSSVISCYSTLTTKATEYFSLFIYYSGLIIQRGMRKRRMYQQQ